jgi:hypothetical protein
MGMGILRESCYWRLEESPDIFPWGLAAVGSNRFTANWTSDDVCCNIATGTAEVSPSYQAHDPRPRPAALSPDR